LATDQFEIPFLEWWLHNLSKW